MNHGLRKLFAIFLAIWLPLLSGAAVAESLAMQMPNGACLKVSVEQGMSHTESGVHHQHDGEIPVSHDTSNDTSDSSCNACGVCHMACAGYLATQDIADMTLQDTSQVLPAYLVSFYSVTITSLDPPPLVLV